MKFYDGLDRRFIPYKGWMKINKDGTFVRDELTLTDEGPFRIIIDTASHGNWHALYNLIDSKGNCILSKGVRKITYFSSLGYYLIEDNNEDELINRGDVKGGFRVKDFQEWYYVVTDDGQMDNSESLIHSLRVFQHKGFFGRFNIEGSVIENGSWLEKERVNINQSEYTAAMWADRGIWGMNVIDKRGYRHYFFGQGDFMTSYAHEVLISKYGTIFLEKDSWWYLKFLNGHMMKCFRNE